MSWRSKTVQTQEQYLTVIVVFVDQKGCRMFTSVKAFEGQQYSTLKRQCLQSGLLFEDPRFPAMDDSLFYQGNRIGRVVWKRPRVIDDLTNTRPGSARNSDVGPPSSRLTTRRKVHEGPVQCGLGSSRGGGLDDPIPGPKLWQ
ncbi:hypothetical protein L3Q82_006602 [Scortum barcoo]|uniref:Uncharacterized protein n=1 Tax=Scortum barcoo TaxID=214431 RepID=A0ACB8WZZ2_9TELE|nr:hypothetical protein L3Q82_006602 [Scortum barcoo]